MVPTRNPAKTLVKGAETRATRIDVMPPTRINARARMLQSAGRREGAIRYTKDANMRAPGAKRPRATIPGAVPCAAVTKSAVISLAAVPLEMIRGMPTCKWGSVRRESLFFGTAPVALRQAGKPRPRLHKIVSLRGVERPPCYKVIYPELPSEMKQ